MDKMINLYTKIDGLHITRLKIFKDRIGSVLHMMRSDSKLFDEFGEIYFSTINKNMIKAWKYHKRITQNFAVPHGSIRLVFYDNRKNSNTFNSIFEFETGIDNYCLIKIPPMIYYGFKGLSDEYSIIANLTNAPHRKNESITIDKYSDEIPYKW